MLTVYVWDQEQLRKEQAINILPAQVVWVVLNPTREEEALVEQSLRLDMPAREEMQ
jgi:hypothetical protein